MCSFTDAGERIKKIFLPDLGGTGNDDVRFETASGTEPDRARDDAIRPDRYVVAERDIGIDERSGMNGGAGHQ